MAGIHAYEHMGRSVVLFAIDHSVGRGGANRMDDVQLIQVVINRLIDRRAALQPGMAWNGRVTDESGRQIAKLKVDGRCGPLTFKAIIATQQMLKRWQGCTVDGRIDAMKDGTHSEYGDGTYRKIYGVEGNRITSTLMEHHRFNTMYILAASTNAAPGRDRGEPGLPAFDLYALPNPLKANLMRAVMRMTFGQFSTPG